MEKPLDSSYRVCLDRTIQLQRMLDVLFDLEKLDRANGEWFRPSEQNH